MIQVGLKPTKLGSNTSAIIQLRDKRYIEYKVSVLSKAESSLCDGPIYFTYFPGHCVGLGDSSDSFTVDVKIKGSGGNDSVVLMYKFHYQVVNRPYLTDYSADFPIDKRGKTTLYLAKIAEGDRVVSKTISWGETETGQGSGTAGVDWRETAKGHVVKVDVPGFKKEEVKVVVEDGGVLQNSAERSEEEDCKERSSGILRRLSLPESVDLDEMKACMENGVLTITVPKEDAMRKKQVKIIEISG